jgi:pyruvate kinase
MERDPGLELALSERLAVTKIAEAVGITRAAVSQWRRVPERHLRAVARVTGLPMKLLRPDLYEAPPRRRRL